jgi:thiamine pyrophosphokinase
LGIFIPKQIKKIGKEAFANNKLKKVEFEPGSLLTHIGKGAFGNNKELNELKFPLTGLPNFKSWRSASNHTFKEGDVITNLYMSYSVVFND